MARVRKQVDRLHIFQQVAAIGQLLEVSHLSGRVAGDVDHTGRAEFHELLEEFRRAPPARRIDQHGGLVSREGDFSKNVLRRRR